MQEEEAEREEAEKAGGSVAYRLADESDDSDDDQQHKGKGRKKPGKGRWAKANGELLEKEEGKKWGGGKGGRLWGQGS